MKQTVGGTQSLDGTGSQQCTLCRHQSLPGLMKGHGKCLFHWAEGNWGREWAAKCYPDHESLKKELEG